MNTAKQEARLLQTRSLVIVGIAIAAAAVRLIPHPMNFAPVGALALFGGAYFASKRAAIIVPLLVLIASDALIGFHSLMLWVYASFLVSVAIGFALRKKRGVARVGAATVAGSIQFFLVTNFAVWLHSVGTYPKTGSGLAACYVAGIPLFWNTLASDLFYSAILFGGMALAGRYFPAMRETEAVAAK